MNNKKALSKSILTVGLIAISLLLVPLVGMQFSDEINWTLSDFIFAGVLLFGTGSAFAFVLTNKGSNFYKAGMGIAILASFLVVWSNGAVGIVGHEGESINILYYGVLAIGLIGSFIARFQAKRMVYALYAMVTSIMIITIIALMGYMQEPPHSSTMQILGVNAFFVTLFLLSAISFRNATKDANSEEVLA